MKDEIERHGSQIRKVKWINRNNAPDRVFGCPNYGTVFVEVKRPGKRPTAAQEREHKRMRDAFMIVVWVNSFQMIDDLMEVCFE